jgi:hypothetical protein
MTFVDLIYLSQSHNLDGFYTRTSLFSIQSFMKALTEEKPTQWLSAYEFKETDPKKH